MDNTVIFLLKHLRPLELNSHLITEDEDTWLSLKEPVDILKTAIGRFRIEKVDNGHKGSADDRPDDPELPAQVRDANGRHLRDHVLHDPVGGHGNGSTQGAVIERVDLRGIDPWYGQQTHAKCCPEYEEEHDRGNVAGLLRSTPCGDQTLCDGDDDPASGTPDRRDYDHTTAAPALNDELGQNREDEIHHGPTR